MPADLNNAVSCLQSWITKSPARSSSSLAKVITITSGNNGVGKTSLTVSLAISIANFGARVCIVDADPSPHNVNNALGLQSQYTLEHLLGGEKTIEDLLLPGPGGISVVPSASSVTGFNRLDIRHRRALLDGLASLESKFDYILIDTSSDITSSVLTFVRASWLSIMVITPDEASQTEAFSMLKILKRSELTKPIHVLVNKANDLEAGKKIFRRFSSMASHYLKLPVSYLGYVAQDRICSLPGRAHPPGILQQQSIPITRCLNTIVARISLQKLEDTTVGATEDNPDAKIPTTNQDPNRQKTVQSTLAVEKEQDSSSNQEFHRGYEPLSPDTSLPVTQKTTGVEKEMMQSVYFASLCSSLIDNVRPYSLGRQ